MELVAPTTAESFALPGDTVVYTYTLYNDDDSAHIFALELTSPRGWATSPIAYVYLDAYDWTSIPLSVTVPALAGNWVEDTVLTASASEMADSAAVRTIVRGPITDLDLWAHPDRIAPDGHQSTILAFVTDDLEWAVADGTEVSFATTLVTLDPMTGTTSNGWVSTTLTSGAATGVAEIETKVGDATGVLTVEISVAPAYSLTLTADASTLPANGISTTQVTAQVYDKYGQPAPDGTEVVFGVEGDLGQDDDPLIGTVEGQEVYTATTSGGTAVVTYQSGQTAGVATVRGQIPSRGLVGEGEGIGAQRWASTDILLTGQERYDIFLPIVYRQ